MSFSFDQPTAGQDPGLGRESAGGSSNSLGYAQSSTEFAAEPGFNFDHDVEPDRPAAPPGRPPLPVLWAALGVAIAGAVFAVAFWGNLIGGLVGWLLAGPTAIFLLGQYVAKDQGMRARPIYDGPQWASKAPLIGGLVILSAVVVTAWAIADTMARMAW